MSRAFFTPPETLSKADIRTIADVRRDIWTNSFRGLCVGTVAGFGVHTVARVGHTRGAWKLPMLSRNTAFLSVLLGGAIGSFVMSVTTGKNQVHNLHPIFQVGARGTTVEPNTTLDGAALDREGRERNRLYRRATLTKSMEQAGGLSDSHGGRWIPDSDNDNQPEASR